MICKICSLGNRDKYRASEEEPVPVRLEGCFLRAREG
jgi:hypothetical protein